VVVLVVIVLLVLVEVVVGDTHCPPPPHTNPGFGVFPIPMHCTATPFEHTPAPWQHVGK